MSEDTKTCPYCAETIKAMAIVCRFCNRDLAPGVPTKPTVPKISAGPHALDISGLTRPSSHVTTSPAKTGSNSGAIALVVFLVTGGIYWASTASRSTSTPDPSIAAAQAVEQAQQAVTAATTQAAVVSTTADLQPKGIDVISDGAMDRQVLSGYVVNTSGRPLRYIEANAEFHDKKGNVVATGMDNEGDTIQPGEKWRFKVTWPTDNATVKTGSITSVKGTFQ